MKNQQIESSTKIVIGVIVAAAIGFIGYMYLGSNIIHATKDNLENNESSKKHVDETKKDLMAKFDKKMESTNSKKSFTDDQIKEIEETVLTLIREKTDLFTSAINEGMQRQQAKAAENLTQIATEAKSDMEKTAFVWGEKDAKVKFYAFIDPVCPHCHEFIKVINKVIEKSKDVKFNLIVSPLLSENSVVLAKIILAAKEQNEEKSKIFVTKLIENKKFNKENEQVSIAKAAGLDSAKLLKSSKSDMINKEIEKNIELVKQLQIPGFPTIFVEDKDGKLVGVPPIQADEYLSIIKKLKDGEKLNNKDENKSSDKDSKDKS